MHEDDENGMSKYLKGLATFINRVGFPIFAFIVLAYFHWVKMEENTKAINEMKEVMIAVKDAMLSISK